MKTLTNRELREQRKDTLRQMQELQSGGRFDQKKFDQLDSQFRTLSAQLEEEESRSMGQIRGGQPGGYGEPTTSYATETRSENPEHRAAFGAFLRRGAAELEPEQRKILFEHRDMGTGGTGAFPGSSGAGGGFFVPVGFVNRVEESMKYVGPMLDGGPGMPEIMPTATGAPLPWPADDDTSNEGEMIGESQQVTMQDVNLQQVVFGAYKFSTKMVKLSLELMQDSSFDLEAYLIKKFATRLGRILNRKFTLGTGTNEPMGLLTAIVNGGNLVNAIGSSSNDGTSAGANTIGTDDLIELEHAIDPLYRNGSRYMLADSTLKTVKKLKNKFGDLIYKESIRDGQPDTINGYPFAINPYLDTLQSVPSSPPATKRSVIFGQLPEFKIRRVRELSVLRLTERYADFAQVAFVGFARYDSQSMDIGHRALAALQNVY